MKEIIIPEGGIHRMKNAAIRIGRTIYLVGSQAKGTANYASDFDYIIPGIRSKEWQKIKNSLPGAKDRLTDKPNRIELIRDIIDITRPYIEVNP